MPQYHFRGTEHSAGQPHFRWSEQDLEMAVCPLCGPEPGRRVRFDFSPFRVVACNNCSLNFLSPRLTEATMLRLYQQQNYFKSAVPGQGYDKYLDVRQNWHRSFARRLYPRPDEHAGARVQAAVGLLQNPRAHLLLVAPAYGAGAGRPVLDSGDDRRGAVRDAEFSGP